MDTTGTFEVCECLSQYKIVTALHKFYTVDDYTEFNKKNIDPILCFYRELMIVLLKN